MIVDEWLADEEEYTNNDVELFTIAWVNEKNCPELLKYQEILVLNLMEMLESQVTFKN
jgi:hypothetical protein